MELRSNRSIWRFCAPERVAGRSPCRAAIADGQQQNDQIDERGRILPP